MRLLGSAAVTARTVALDEGARRRIAGIQGRAARAGENPELMTRQARRARLEKLRAEVLRRAEEHGTRLTEDEIADAVQLLVRAHCVAMAKKRWG